MYKHAVLLAILLMNMNTAYSADIETLLMPGAVISGHAKLESECTSCHVFLGDNTQSRLCRDCHEDVDSDILKGKGFHSSIESVKTRPCRECHTDHTGRNADIILLNPATFNHQDTDFDLEGAHSQVPCSSCHTDDKKYSEAPSACLDCHESDDPHKGELGDECDSCHSVKEWTDFKFNHDDTDFKLTGEHREVGCNKCHANNNYENTPDTCLACHDLNDVHDGRNGDECDECHSTEKWDSIDFDHDKDTEFKLVGSHKDLECLACHKEGMAEDSVEKECNSCHAEDDQHQSRNGVKCHDCHNQTSWDDAKFNHTTKTDFPLEGAHKELICASCHRGVLSEENLSTDCIDCHRTDDVHKGEQGEECQLCHQNENWTSGLVFEHDLSHFPLLGLHASVPCEECHLSPEFKSTESDCNSCHAKDDEHKTTFGTNCEKCHNPNGWGIWTFDHDNTDFKLENAHSDLHCNQCHFKPLTSEVKQSTQCQSCHYTDDIHRGQFGRDCGRCHTTENFRDINNDKLRLQ